jgi:hypothetical protein
LPDSEPQNIDPQLSDAAEPVVAAPPESLPPEPAAAQPIVAQPVIARGGMYYRNTRYIMAALTVLMGFWFGYDGFVRWPAENEQIKNIESEISSQDPATAAHSAALLKDHSKHTQMDILLQRVLAFSLPPLGILLLVWALFNSRGEYRLADDTLYLPGHPPIPLASIRELDQTAWDRKGIARVSYELSDARTGTAKLDDFVYDRDPTDKIYDQIKLHLQPPPPVPSEPAAEATPGLPPV